MTISDSKMTKWRKECESERKRQLAEEGEARRLRAENRILQGRIQSLEKENNTLAGFKKSYYFSYRFFA